jgi:hypothetical protein
MTPDDELERELASFRPRPPSPELRRRVGRRLNRPRILAFAALSAAAAAVVVAVVLNRPNPPAPDVIVKDYPAVSEPSAPTVLAYRHAAARSPDRFEALLDQQAVRSAEHSLPVRAAFTLRGPRE